MVHLLLIQDRLLRSSTNSSSSTLILVVHLVDMDRDTDSSILTLLHNLKVAIILHHSSNNRHHNNEALVVVVAVVAALESQCFCNVQQLLDNSNNLHIPHLSNSMGMVSHSILYHSTHSSTPRPRINSRRQGMVTAVLLPNNSHRLNRMVDTVHRVITPMLHCKETLDLENKLN
jgi:hypothetical protein